MTCIEWPGLSVILWPVEGSHRPLKELLPIYLPSVLPVLFLKEHVRL